MASGDVIDVMGEEQLGKLSTDGRTKPLEDVSTGSCAGDKKCAEVETTDCRLVTMCCGLIADDDD